MAFGAAWSPPWRLLAAALADLAAEGVTVETIDVDADPAAAERHRITTVPTILVMAGGGERRRVTGAVSPAQLRQLVRS
jgi:thioredoxin-like negative regulator of GroEL